MFEVAKWEWGHLAEPIEFSQFELGWLVGLCDGEASFQLDWIIVKNKVYSYPRFECGMNDKDTLDKLVALLGLNPATPVKKKTGTLHWRARSKKVSKVLPIFATLYPYLSFRRRMKIAEIMNEYEMFLRSGGDEI